MMIRRAVLLLAVVGAVSMLAAGTALAATVQCTGGECDGTEQSDVINGSDGFDRISALGGDDSVYGGVGVDEIFGGDGNDRLSGGQVTT